MEHPTLDLKPVRHPGTEEAPSCAPALHRDQRPTLDHACVDRMEPEPPADPLFGEWLVLRRVLSRAQLLRALEASHLHEFRVGDAVVVLRLATRERIEVEAQLFHWLRQPADPLRQVLERKAQRIERAWIAGHGQQKKAV